MSRSVSAPSSVTKTSPCWNGDIVPGSTFRYGSNFCSCTRRPRAFSRRPSDAATIPFPSADTTPPVTKTYFGARALTGFQGSSVGGRRASFGGRLDEVVEPRERERRERAPHHREGRLDREALRRAVGSEHLELDLRVEPLARELERDAPHRHDVEDEQRPRGVWPA